MAQMEVSYSRRLDYQYMMIETDEEARSDYRLSMLINNRINGFLPVHVQQMIAVLQCSFRGGALFARRRRNIA